MASGIFTTTIAFAELATEFHDPKSFRLPPLWPMVFRAALLPNVSSVRWTRALLSRYPRLEDLDLRYTSDEVLGEVLTSGIANVTVRRLTSDNLVGYLGSPVLEALSGVQLWPDAAKELMARCSQTLKVWAADEYMSLRLVACPALTFLRIQLLSSDLAFLTTDSLAHLDAAIASEDAFHAVQVWCERPTSVSLKLHFNTYEPSVVAVEKIVPACATITRLAFERNDGDLLCESRCSIRPRPIMTWRIPRHNVLRSLELCELSLSDSCLAEMGAACSGLEELSLRQIQGVSKVGMNVLEKHLRALRVLILSGFAALEAAGPLIGKHLRQLSLTHCNCGPETLASLHKYHPALKSLAFNHVAATAGDQSAWLDNVLACCGSRLETLSIQFSGAVHPELLAMRCPRLQRAEFITSTTASQPQPIVALAEACADLQILVCHCASLYHLQHARFDNEGETQDEKWERPQSEGERVLQAFVRERPLLIQFDGVAIGDVSLAKASQAFQKRSAVISWWKDSELLNRL